MYLNVYGNCEKCGADLKAIDTTDYYDGRHLCSKCRALEPPPGIASATITLNNCEKCGAPLDKYSFPIAGQRLCSLCEASQGISSIGVPPLSDSFGVPGLSDYSIGVPTLSGSIGLGISDLEKGIFDWDSISIVDPRDEQIAKLQARVEELEQTDYVDKEEVSDLKQRLAALEKEVSISRDKKVVNPSFGKLCQVLERWIPRRSRKYEEAYKAELVEYLSHRFLHVKEEARGGLCDILIAEQHPIHLKVSPTKNEYNTLCGQIIETLKEFEHVACVIVATPSSQRYEDFVERICSVVETSKVYFSAKAK